ncbi:MAG: amidohydrolase [Oscillospiraceae bacterium]|nr:amidohydrolase [Oscillospiraceae bacterium]
MKIFDAHTHAYPDDIAEKACINLGKFYEFTVHNAGTVDALIKSEKESGSSGFALFSVATSPEQVIKINNWLDEVKIKYSDESMKIVCFTAMHHDFADKAGEVDRTLAMGFKGVKIHPDIQQIDIDSEKLMPLYETLQGCGIMYFHAGDSRYDYSLPEKIVKIKKLFPRLEIIAAHLGGYQRWETFEKIYRDKNIYIDTSSTSWAMPLERAREIIINYDPERILFGTDYPVSTAKTECEYIDKLRLNYNLTEKILYANAEKLFGL